MTRTVKVAVIGSGLAGLTAAYRIAKTERLGDVQFEVHLFEKASSVGMDSHSVSVEVPGYEGEYRVDVPMRSFQGGYYPQLIALYKHLGVRFREADFTYSFSSLNAGAGHAHQTPQRFMKTTMIYNGQSGLKGVGMPTSLFPPAATGYSPSALAAWAWAYAGFVLSTIFVLIFYLRLVMFSLPLRLNTTPTTPRRQTYRHQLTNALLTLSSKLLPCRPPADTTLREWTVLTTPSSPIARFLSLDTRWQEFVQHVIVPLFSAVCTCGEEMVWELPIEEVLDYVYLTFRTHHYVVSNGVRDVAKRMSSCIPPSRIHLGMPIISLVYSFITGDSAPTVDIHCVGGNVFKGFSHVVMATQANHASRLLQSYLDTVPHKVQDKSQKRHFYMVSRMVDALSEIKYCKSIVVNHTDSTLMPENHHDRRDLNLITFASSPSEETKPLGDEHEELCVPPSYTMATHIVPTPVSTPKSSPEDIPVRVYQTTNPIIAPREDTILSVARLERAVVTVTGKRAVRNFWRAAGDNEDHFGREKREFGSCDDSEEDSGLESDEPSERPFKWGCAASQRSTLGPLQGAGRLASRSLRSRRSMPSLRATNNTRRLQAYREPGIWVCGSYAHSGIPLLEGCVVSARNVVEQGIWPAEGVQEEGEKVRALW
ncbi:hypothetical protein BXZ70DRAFT_106039 [Cristinia sonorae]|uniref:Amine oxidase domain-containing protein n=1 Tax=Cristinia sonorae TaxID=1940300 RepID=A0A8K0UR98_9AGAR|nr:hypothetical protein BXZ70DRAFT_106039 [Cristinia sonorae]